MGTGLRVQHLFVSITYLYMQVYTYASGLCFKPWLVRYADHYPAG